MAGCMGRVSQLVNDGGLILPIWRQKARMGLSLRRPGIEPKHAVSRLVLIFKSSRVIPSRRESTAVMEAEWRRQTRGPRVPRR
jgi:hypothetical protein